jgi:hypothetical protein
VLWVGTLVLGLSLFFLPAIGILVFVALLIAATALSLPKVSRHHAVDERPDRRNDPRARFDANPDAAKHDPRGGTGWH